MSSADQRVLTTLSGLDDPRARFDAVELESPRSLLALRRCGLRQADLAPVARADVPLPRGGLSDPEAAREALWAARERDRRECLRQAIQQYTRIATLGITFAESVAYPELRPYFMKESRPARDPRLRQTLSGLSSMRAAERAAGRGAGRGTGRGAGRVESPAEARAQAQRIYDQYGRQQDAYMRTLVSSLQGDAALRRRQRMADERTAARAEERAGRAEERALKATQHRQLLDEARDRWERELEEKRERIVRSAGEQQERARERRELADSRRAALQRAAVAERDRISARQAEDLARAEEERMARTAKLQRELDEKEERFRARRAEQTRALEAQAARNGERARRAQEQVASALRAETEARVAMLREEQERASARHAQSLAARRGETAARLAREAERYSESRRGAEDARRQEQERREARLQLESAALADRRQKRREREQEQRELSRLQKDLADDLYRRRVERLRRKEEFEQGTRDYCGQMRQQGLEARREAEGRRAVRSRELSAQLQDSVRRTDELIAPLLRAGPSGPQGQRARELARHISAGDRERALATMRAAVRAPRPASAGAALPARAARPQPAPGEEMYALIRRAEENGGLVTLGCGRDGGAREAQDRLREGLPRRPVLRPATARPSSRGPSFSYTECV